MLYEVITHIGEGRTDMLESVAFSAFLMGIISTCSLPMGTITTKFWTPSDRFVAWLMAFGGGALLAALTLDLVGSALSKGHFYPMAMGAMIGGLMFIGLNQVINSYGGYLRKSSTTMYYLRRKRQERFRHVLGQIERVPVFKGLPGKTRRALASLVQLREYPADTVLYRRFDPPDNRITSYNVCYTKLLRLKYKEPEVDLAAISDESRALIKTAMIATGLIGLYLIWSSVFPALRVFEDVDLWHYTVTVAGEEQQLPVTLADLGLALIYALGIGVLAKRLPSVLEIILLRRFDLTAASRYTVTSLVNYAIIVVGILIVLNTIGAQWAQLQWLVAALGVGIGFGLQEIVANFISGLIILFERPIRVGDVVTVGATDGVVTRIRIRATTIRGWDHKELIVPNKEFVTGRLLNWTLSDPITRINIIVGVAYGSDVDKALALMKEAAAEHERVLVDPAPILSFEGFGDSSLTLILRACVVSIDYRLATMTDLHKAIKRKFEQAGIVIAFPQRDVHFHGVEPLRVRIEAAKDSAINTGNLPPDA